MFTRLLARIDKSFRRVILRMGLNLLHEHFASLPQGGPEETRGLNAVYDHLSRKHPIDYAIVKIEETLGDLTLRDILLFNKLKLVEESRMIRVPGEPSPRVKWVN